MIRHVVYLHGFASSPHSTKAVMLSDRLARHGVTLRAPDFNEPEFSTLTVTRMLDQTARELADVSGPVALVGSSLGGFVAVHAAARRRAAGAAAVARLILLAPAFEFGANRMRQLGPGGIDDWKTTDRLEVFHYGYGSLRWVHYALYEDAQKYDAYAVDVDAPTLILYGTRDESVEPASVERWACGRANVTLRSVDDGHQLTNSLEIIWEETAKALGLT